MSIYQHFREFEHQFVDQVISWKEQVERSYQPQLTDFLDPREQQILTSLIGSSRDEIKVTFNGGKESFERKRALIAPMYEPIEFNDYQLTVLEAKYPKKFISIEHRDVMGALLSLGLERKKLGDIIVAKDKFQVVIAHEISPYVLINMTRINRASINLKEISNKELIDKKEEWRNSDHIVSSLRLDIIVKEIYRISRKNAVEFIQKDLVKVNFQHVNDPATQLIEGDLISLRGKGRSKFIKINGRTRKDKWSITTAQLKSN